jgi:hypothetical protein
MASRDSQVIEVRALLRAQMALRAEYCRVSHLPPDDPRRVAYGERLKTQKRRLHQFVESGVARRIPTSTTRGF